MGDVSLMVSRKETEEFILKTLEEAGHPMTEDELVAAFNAWIDSKASKRVTEAVTQRPEFLMQFFSYSHLPKHLQDVSRWFFDVADHVVNELPSNPERTTALRKLLEAKDCAVRAALAKELGQ